MCEYHSMEGKDLELPIPTLTGQVCAFWNTTLQHNVWLARENAFMAEFIPLQTSKS